VIRPRGARGNANLPRTLRVRGEAYPARLALLPVANQNQKFPSFQKNGGGVQGGSRKKLIGNFMVLFSPLTLIKTMC